MMQASLHSSPYHLVQGRHGLFLINQNDRYIGQSFLKYGEYNHDEWLMLKDILNVIEGDVIEVGANIGAHSIGIARHLSTKNFSLHLFEPQEIIFQNLCANISLNALTNAHTHLQACGAENKTILIPKLSPFIGNNFGGVRILQENLHTQALMDEVACVTLDDVLASRIQKLACIKVDVEGMELEVLKGATKLITQHRPVLYVENDSPEKSPDLVTHIQAQNYRLWWHMPRLFSPNNFLGQVEDIFPNLASFNMLCMPVELELPVLNLKEIKHPQEEHPLAKKVLT